jgi:NADH-quinone oxidoreductase subunit L
VAHGVSKALLFLGAGSVTHGTHKTEIWDMGGIRRRMPITTVTFLIGAASLAGVVPLSGFFSKDEVLLAVFDHRHVVFLVLALGAAALSALYMARVAFVVFFGRLKDENDEAKEPSPVMTIPLVLLALFAATVGFLAFNWTSDYPGLAGFVQVDQLALGEDATSHVFHIEPWLTVLSAVVALGGVALGWAVYGTGTVSRENVAQRLNGVYRLLMNKYYVDELYQWVVDRVVLAFSRFVALFDRIVLNDTGVDGPAWSIVLSAVRLRYVQTGRMYNYGLVMILGLIALSLIWWIWLI